MNGTEPINVTRSSMPPFDEYCEEIRDLWNTRVLTNAGAKHVELERALQEYLGVECVDLFVNGHSALECVIEAMELGKDGRDEVITTPFTFVSTIHAIVRKGLKPVFCDIKLDDCTIDPELIEELVTERTCAIMPVHVYGRVCDVASIQDMADRRDLTVIYDAAHAFGVQVDGVGVGTFGDASMFSFHATKVFNTIEGGAIAHSNTCLTEKLAQWRNFGISSPEDVVYIGGNSKMNEFAAAMGLCNLRHIEEDIAKRKVVAERYYERLSEIIGVRLFDIPMGLKWNYAYFPVLFSEPFNRDEVQKSLANEGIFARKYFYPTVDSMTCYAGRFASSCSRAHYASEHVLTLPMSSELTVDQVDRICDIVLRA